MFRQRNIADKSNTSLTVVVGRHVVVGGRFVVVVGRHVVIGLAVVGLDVVPGLSVVVVSEISPLAAYDFRFFV